MLASALIALVLSAPSAVGDDVETAKTLTGLVVNSLGRHKALSVVSSEDVRRVVELEADKQAMGCSDDASCLAEVAGALGARYVVYGQVGRLGASLVLTLNLFDPQNGAAVGRVAARAATVEALADQLDPAVDQLVAPVATTAAKVLVLDLRPPGYSPDGATTTTTEAAPGGGPSVAMLAGGAGVAGVGALVGGAGVALAVLAMNAQGEAEAEPIQTRANAKYDERDLYGVGAIATWIGGGVLFVGGAALAAAAFVVGSGE